MSDIGDNFAQMHVKMAHMVKTVLTNAAIVETTYAITQTALVSSVLSDIRGKIAQMCVVPVLTVRTVSSCAHAPTTRPATI